ncbi:hypothetical protein [Cumulibacter soli]|uniref:hypothetical protein n=1 Tax=Cumulibacter soli TaxID=2546344 RepID=UPI001FB9DDD0|nr:hypothetical protein [Cumulibacter soli]
MVLHAVEFEHQTLADDQINASQASNPDLRSYVDIDPSQAIASNGFSPRLGALVYKIQESSDSYRSTLERVPHVPEHALALVEHRIDDCHELFVADASRCR